MSQEEPRQRRVRSKPPEIIAKLKAVDTLLAQGRSIISAIRQIGIPKVTYYRWRKRYSKKGKN